MLCHLAISIKYYFQGNEYIMSGLATHGIRFSFQVRFVKRIHYTHCQHNFGFMFLFVFFLIHNIIITQLF
jgi:hypothetical protein